MTLLCASIYNYSYASWNKVPDLRTVRKVLKREATYEIGMEFKGRTPDSNFYKFSLARPHQGHDYYSGASGSPIIDPEGKVVSILLGSPKNQTDILFGLPLKDYIHLLDIDLEISQAEVESAIK